jgi:hypothetical protein
LLLFIFMVVLLHFLLPSVAAGSHDPRTTITIFIPGFQPDGESHQGVFGDDVPEPLLEEIAALVGLPTINDPLNATIPNVVTSTSYYGDTAPSYYTAQDQAELDVVTAEWGGGVPRYALIVAKYARYAMERAGAEQVNFLSASFGSFVTRWLIEKDSDGLASEGRIARWLSYEGVTNGSWVATKDELIQLWKLFDTPPIDVAQMDYGWIEANLHSPRIEGASPFYSSILIGQHASTKDDANNGALTTAMLVWDEFQPNDGVQGVKDMSFATMTPSSLFLGRMPAVSYFHVNHYGLEMHEGAWVNAVMFLTGRRRVTVTMTRARVYNMHEPDDFPWDWTPAEILFESRVFSPDVANRWGIADPLSSRHRDGASTPIRRFDANGEEQFFSHLLFDDFVLETETSLNVELWSEDIDYDLRYGVVEPLGDSYNSLGGGWINVPITPGTYAFATNDWECDITVSVFDYPFPAATDANLEPAKDEVLLTIFPNPSRNVVFIRKPGALGVSTLSIYDAGGRVVRILRGELGSGFQWDGRDSSGREVAPGVYLYRVLTNGDEYRGRSTILR